MAATTAVANSWIFTTSYMYANMCYPILPGLVASNCVEPNIQAVMATVYIVIDLRVPCQHIIYR